MKGLWRLHIKKEVPGNCPKDLTAKDNDFNNKNKKQVPESTRSNLSLNYPIDNGTNSKESMIEASNNISGNNSIHTSDVGTNIRFDIIKGKLIC